MINRLYFLGLLAGSLSACLSPSPVDDPPEPSANRSPIALASSGSSFAVGSSVTLNGLDSYDPDGDPLVYSWAVQIPGTAAPLEIVGPEVFLDLREPGQYLFDLTVEDPAGSQSTTSVVIRAVVPVVNLEVTAGQSGIADIFQEVAIHGSIDVNGALETNFSWELLSAPSQSTAELANSDTLEPSFVADRVGEYVIELRVESPWSRFTSEVAVVATASQLSAGGRYVGFDYSPATGQFAGTVNSSVSDLLQLLDLAVFSEVAIPFERPRGVSYTSDGTQLVLAYGTSATPFSISQIDATSGSVLATIPGGASTFFHTTLNNQIISTANTGATVIDLTNGVTNSVSGTLGPRLLAATNAGNKFYAWRFNDTARVGRLVVTNAGPQFLGSHDFAADDCNPLWSSPTGEFVMSGCGKLLRVSDDENLDLTELGTLPVTAIESAVHATELGLIIVATADGDEYSLRAFDDVTLEEEWVRPLPQWYAPSSSSPLTTLAPRALYVLPDGETLVVLGQTGTSYHQFLRFRL